MIVGLLVLSLFPLVLTAPGGALVYKTYHGRSQADTIAETELKHIGSIAPGEGLVAVDRVVLFTDMQIWDSTARLVDGDRTVRAAFDDYRTAVSPEASLYTVDLASYGNLATPEGYEDVYNISGWSEQVLELIGSAEEPAQVIGEIDAFEPV